MYFHLNILFTYDIIKYTIKVDKERNDLYAQTMKLKQEMDDRHERIVELHIEEDNARKGNGDPNAKYKSMAARHKKIFQKKWARWMMRRSWGRKLMFVFFGKKKDKKSSAFYRDFVK